MTVSVRTILIANVVLVFLGLTVAYVFGMEAYKGADGVSRGGIDEAYPYTLMTIGVALVTFFGLLELPGGKEPSGAYISARIRFAITVTLLLVCIVYFATTGYWLDEKPSEYATMMVPILERLLIITIAFYFGATALTEMRSPKEKPRETGSASDARVD
jgi:hypothetical protein